MHPVRSLLLASLLSLLLPAVAHAATRYASPNGTGPAPACAQAAPCAIDDAVDAAVDGDAVSLAPGRYAVATELTVDDAIELHGGPGLALPLISSSAPVGISVQSPGAVVRDLAIDQGAAGNAAIEIAAGTVDRVRATSTSGSGGAACELGSGSGSPALLRDSTCWSASAGAGGVAISSAADGAAVTLNAYLRGVTAYATGPGSSGIALSGSGGGSALIDARDVIASGTGADVRADSAAGGGAAATLADSNFATTQANGPGSTITAPGSSGNQAAEPRLVDPGAGQFDQLAGSPTIDAGAADALLGALDVNFDARVQNQTPDIGADEFPDRVPPQTTIDSGPSGPTTNGKPTFAFSSSEPGSSFACQLDSEPFTPCRSPTMLESLLQGPHKFSVAAIDPAGNIDPTPAESAFAFDRGIYGNVKAKRRQRQKGQKVILKVEVRATEDVRVSAAGKVKASRKSFAVRSRATTLLDGKPRTLRLKPKKRSAGRAIHKALKRGKGVSAVLTATFTDDLGNRATSGDVFVALKGR